MKTLPILAGLILCLALDKAQAQVPHLQIHHLDQNQILLIWTNANAVVEEADHLPASYWRTPAQAAAFNGTEYSLTLPLTNAARFYRLLVGLPPEPATIASAIDPTVPTDLAVSTEFLYAGSNPIQTGVTNGTIEPVRAAVIRGQVRQRDNAPLPGVTITILNHLEFGQTLSRADGMFDLAVNGGGSLTVVYRKDGFLPAQRQVDVPWRDFVFASDAILIPLDNAVTLVAFGSNAPAQVAKGTVQTDADGSRQATFFRPARARIFFCRMALRSHAPRSTSARVNSPSGRTDRKPCQPSCRPPVFTRIAWS